MSTTSVEKTPVTVLTGFLGSGKTTLLNRILTEQHGLKIAVIENEYGEVGIDNDLIINAEEEIFEMNNGCICCTVRGDLIRILGTLMRRRERFDHILIETTGLADPGPVIQTFFVDDEIQQLLALDGVVTLVDAAHLALHLDDALEASEQIAFADVIVLNKIDLVEPETLDWLEQRIRALNGVAEIHRVQQAAVPVNRVVGVGGFDLARGLQVEPELLTPSYPFEWLGAYELTAGSYTLHFGAAPDPAVSLLLLAVPSATDAEVDARLREATIAFSEDAAAIGPDGMLSSSGGLVSVPLTAGGSSVALHIQEPGSYVLFCEHGAAELELALLDHDGVRREPALARQIAPDHEHDETVGSVGITEPGDLHGERFNAWLSRLLQEKGQDIFRMKGVLAIDGAAERFVFQGVHMLFDGRPDRPWGQQERVNKLIFIGRNLDAGALQQGFRACLA